MPVLTIKQQKLLIEMYNNDGEIKKTEQAIYQSHCFYEKMQELKSMGLVKSDVAKDRNGKGFKPLIYYLTYKGDAFTKILLGESWLC